ncbi:MAG: alpha/beta hydrolase [Alphaproteobacteria bacterium]|nr:alpha/beta hydrolase [Alphaproteobacteria bacterium]
MTMRIWLAALLCVVTVPAQAQAQVPAFTEVFVAVDTGRTRDEGGKAVPVTQRAILTLPARPTDTALLFFRGNPGYMLANSVDDKRRNLGWIGRNGEAHRVLMQSGIALAQMDCPTDQWGETPRPPATACLNDYRKSRQHADDVRKMLAHLKERHGLAKAYILGHSIGTVSSRWLNVNLAKGEVAGIVHSATINVANPKGHLLQVLGNLWSEFPGKAADIPMLHVHHQNDACPVTPYGMVRAYAKGNLVRVKGGEADGDPCGAGHHHSHQGSEAAAMGAIVAWIRTGRVETTVEE